MPNWTSRLALGCFLALTATLDACDRDPLTPLNHNPTIRSLVVTPNVIERGDSLLATCDASDLDSDALEYDWITDTRLRIQGAPSGVMLFGTTSNRRIFYYGTPPTIPDSAWIQCIVRDSRGGAEGRFATLSVR